MERGVRVVRARQKIIEAMRTEVWILAWSGGVRGFIMMVVRREVRREEMWRAVVWNWVREDVDGLEM